jgi:hypothetical protein
MTMYEANDEFLKRSVIIISQLREDRNRLQDAFDKARAEIVELADYDAYTDVQQAFNDGLWEAVKIIDKYKLESEKQ